MLAIFIIYIRNYIISKWDVLIAIHNFSELKSLANNIAKLDPRLNFYLYSSTLRQVWLNLVKWDWKKLLLMFVFDIS